MTTKNETLQAKVTRVLRNYKKNASEMLEIIYAGMEHWYDPDINNKTPVLNILNAVYNTADYSIVTSIIRQMSDQSVTIQADKDKEGNVTIKLNESKKTGKIRHATYWQVVHGHVAKGVSFRNAAFLQAMGLRMGETKEWTLDSATFNFAKALIRHDVQLKQAIEALTAAYAANTGETVKPAVKGKPGPVTDKNNPEKRPSQEVVQ